MKYVTTCETCDHRVSAFTHHLNKPLVNVFIRFVEEYLRRQEPVNPNREIKATHNQLANWQKLRYFDLIKEADGDGKWVPTSIGIDFYYNDVAVLTPVATINAEVIPDDHEAWETHTRDRQWKTIREIEETHYKTRPEYQAEKSPQQTFAL